MAFDCVAAALFAVVLIAGTSHPAHGIPLWVAYLPALVTALPAAVRRQWPLAVLGIVTAGSALVITFGTSQNPSLVVAFVIYIVAAWLPRRASVAALVGTLAVTAAVAAAPTLGHTEASAAASRMVTSIIVIAAAWTIGLAVRQQRAYATGLREQADRQAKAQRAEERRGITEERLRIARELHDVVAHSLSLIAVQAGVGNYVAAARPQEAARALSSIEATSRGALHEMRRLLGVLRDEGATADLRPAHGLDDLGLLIKGTAAAGVLVHLEIRGTPCRVPPGIDLAAYRIIQEALTNVVKHAETASSWVVVTYQENAVCIEVTDDGRGTPTTPVSAGAGHGIVGMRERVALYAGEFSAGPLPGHGFHVAARLPLDSTPG